MTYDLMIRNARLRNGASVDIAIAEGKYAAIEPQVKEAAKTEISADGRLVTESFVIAQLHLDKVLTGDWLDAAVKSEYLEGTMGGAMTTIERAAAVKLRYVEDDVLQRIRTVMNQAEAAGVTHIRAFIDIDSKAQLKAVRAALRARQEWLDRVDLQIVAFPQDGLVREPGAEELVREAMKLGADLVGGIPWIEFTDEDMRRHVDIVFDIAEENDKDVAMLVDDAGDPDLRTTEYFAKTAIERGWIGRVTACHSRAMSLYNEVYHRKLVALLKRAQMGIVTNPHTGPLHVRVQELTSEGIPLALGGESVNDPYYPFGRCNMLEVAFVSAHTLWMMSPHHQDMLYNMITVGPAKIMGLPPHSISPGNAADLVVLQELTLREALTTHTDPRYVVRNGQVRCETAISRRQAFGGATKTGTSENL
jgi:cytosine/creatinine deaminase